jgi:sensor histidine kinase YesM
MATVSASQPRILPPVMAWPRVRFTLGVSTGFGILLTFGSPSPAAIVIARTVLLGIAICLVFGLFERWPRRLPRWLARSALQLIAIFFVVPIAGAISFRLLASIDPLWQQQEKKAEGLGALIFTGMLFAPWIAVGAMLQQRDTRVREQATAFELERSEFERSQLDARLRLLQAQVEPHFLFNTLANVQALVDAGSPQASKVLASLIAYLRAAVPRMHTSSASLGEELELVRAYLEVMQMRMPDRLQFTVRFDPAVRQLQCPPMTLLTLVENAVRHGIDPSETGGRIEVDVALHDGQCRVRVTDTGVGLRTLGAGLGTGLSTLRERLRLAHGDDASLSLTGLQPHGVCAELSFPVRAQPA